MNRKRDPFNPFIVLSDVTMATLVVVCCMLMVYLHQTLKGAEEARSRAYEAEQFMKQYQEQLKQIAENQKALEAVITRDLGVGYQNSWSRGTTRVLFRICDSAVKDGRRYPLFVGHRLTDEGRAACLQAACALADPLRLQQFVDGRRSGYLTEIQIQGHCNNQSAGDLWRLSINRALAVKEVLSTAPDFPSGLITVSGAANVRRAYQSTDYYVKQALGNRKAHDKTEWWRTFDALQAKAAENPSHLRKALPDRIDITFVYAGEQWDDSLVPARDPKTRDLLGPKIDTAHDGYDRALFPPEKLEKLLEQRAPAAPSAAP